MKITVVLEKTENNRGAFTPDEIGSALVVGGTREETIENFRAALKFHLEGLREYGRPVPDVTELEIEELIAA